MSENTTMYAAEFAEARRVLDTFPVGHAQALQERVRDGLIDGGLYIDYQDDNVCTTCFYGTLAMEEAGIKFNQVAREWTKQLQAGLGLSRGIAPTRLERLLQPARGGIQYGDTPATNTLSAALDTWLTSYISGRVAAE